ncbi:MAG: nucleoside-diphosphate kinase, partial [Candidatus Omnitrophota bacterium]
PPKYEAGRGFFLFPKSERVFADLDANGVPNADTVVDAQKLSYLTGLGHAMVDGNMRVDAFKEKPGQKVPGVKPEEPNQVFELLLGYGMQKWFEEKFGRPAKDAIEAKKAFLGEFRSRFVDESKLVNGLQRDFVQENILLAYLLGGSKGKAVWDVLYSTSAGQGFRGPDNLNVHEWQAIQTSSQRAVKQGPELKEFMEGLMKYIRFTNLNTFYFAFDRKVASAFLDEKSGYQHSMAKTSDGTFFLPRRTGMELDWSSHVLTPMTVALEDWLSPKYYDEKAKKLYPDVEDWAQLWKMANSVKAAAGGDLSAAPFGPFWFDTGKVDDIDWIVRMAVQTDRLWPRIFIREAFRLPLFTNEVGEDQYPKAQVEFKDPDNYLMIRSKIKVPAGVTVKIGKGVILDHTELVIDAKAGETVEIPDGTILVAVKASGLLTGAGENRYYYHHTSDRGLDFNDQPSYVGDIYLKDSERPVTLRHDMSIDPKSSNSLDIRLSDGTKIPGLSFKENFFGDKKKRIFDFSKTFNSVVEIINSRSEARTFRDDFVDGMNDGTVGFVLIKPDGIQDRETIIASLKANFDEVHVGEPITFTEDQALAFYEVHKDKPFYKALAYYIQGGLDGAKYTIPIFVVRKQGNAVQAVRDLVPSIRGQQVKAETPFGKIFKNKIHASDSQANAVLESGIAYRSETRVEKGDIRHLLMRKAPASEIEAAVNVFHAQMSDSVIAELSSMITFAPSIGINNLWRGLMASTPLELLTMIDERGRSVDETALNHAHKVVSAAQRLADYTGNQISEEEFFEYVMSKRRKPDTLIEREKIRQLRDLFKSIEHNPRLLTLTYLGIIVHDYGKVLDQGDDPFVSERLAQSLLRRFVAVG